MVDDDLIALEFGLGKAKGKIIRQRRGCDVKPRWKEHKIKYFLAQPYFMRFIYIIWLPIHILWPDIVSNAHSILPTLFVLPPPLSLAFSSTVKRFISMPIYIDHTLLHIHVQFNRLNISIWWFRKVYFFIACSFFCILTPHPRTFCTVSLYLYFK